MKREPLTPRPGWREQCEALGFEFHSIDGVYWDERACYAFSADEVDALEAATEELHRMCLEAVARVVADRRWDEFAIPAAFAPYVEASWMRRDKSLYGRFDLAWNGADGSRGPPKLLEYNADTPTALLEASVVQWYWLKDVHPGRDQFNSLHEKLIERWKDLRGELSADRVVHFSCVKDRDEDVGNLDYLRDVATQAGIDARHVYVEDLGWDAEFKRFVDLDGIPVRAWFKLYPWEWLVREEFGANLLAADIRVIEPPWKMILSNKAILPVLWELFPDHPNLLPAYFSPDRLGHDFVKKPKLSREGGNILMRSPNRILYEGGSYGSEGFVYQGLADIPCYDGNYTVIGSWVIGDEAAGIGLREDDTPITRNTSRFVPHYFA
jgi:glutathionylspermidine synthase